jgi:hypothetical protein
MTRRRARGTTRLFAPNPQAVSTASEAATARRKEIRPNGVTRLGSVWATILLNPHQNDHFVRRQAMKYEFLDRELRIERSEGPESYG